VARVLRELHPQIQELAATWVARDVGQLFLLGSGDSWFVGLMARLAFEQYGGVPVEPLQAYEYAAYGHPGFEARTAAIIISSSGRPTTTWDALERALATRAYVVGISDQRYTGNPFIEKAHTALVPGAVKKGMPAQTTTATLAVLIDLAIEFGRASGHLSSSQADDNSTKLRASVEHMQTVLVDSDNLAGPLAQALQGRRFYTFIGGGPSYGVAHVGSALLAEGPQEVGLPLAVEEFHHALRFGTIVPGEPVVLIAPTGQVSRRNLDTAQSVSNWGGQLIAIVDENDEVITPLAETAFILPPVPEPMSPLLALLPLHNLSVQLATHKIAAGYQRPAVVP
jgi:glucosamine 6-phosphate synthetase-like amidotransferase/phosphosugar isomerase protein